MRMNNNPPGQAVREDFCLKCMIRIQAGLSGIGMILKETLWKGRPYHAGDMRYDVQSLACFQNSSLLNPF